LVQIVQKRPKHTPRPQNLKFKKNKKIAHTPQDSILGTLLLTQKKRKEKKRKEKNWVRKKKKEFRLGYMVCSYGRRQPTYEPTCLWL